MPLLNLPTTKRLQEIMELYQLTQLIDSPTCITNSIPLFKSGQRSLLDNYRPISILPVVSKLMERILHDQIYEYFDQQNLFSKH